jgi:hypothetical protein
MIRAVYLCYYPEKAERGLRELRRLLENLGHAYTLTVVNNSNATLHGAAIRGDNTNWEFTGWDRGIAAVGQWRKDDCFVFANDTFNAHRPWNFLHRWCFEREIKRFIEAKASGLCGHWDEPGLAANDFSIMGIPLRGWISTYLFAMSGDLLARLGGHLSLPEEVLDAMVAGIDDGRIVWGDTTLTGDGLRAHLQEWMFGHTWSWQKSGASDERTKLRKIKTILNEKHISAVCIAQGGAFHRVAAPRSRYNNRVLARELLPALRRSTFRLLRFGKT